MSRTKIPEDFKVPDGYRVIDYSFHLGDLIGGTAHLSNAQYGGYMRVLIALVNKPEGISMSEFKAYSRMSGRYWSDFWSLVGGKFVEKDGIIHHERVREQVRKQAYKSYQNRANALLSHETGSANAQRNSGERSANHLTTKPHKESLSRYDVEMFLKDSDWVKLRRDFGGWDFKYYVRQFNDFIVKKGQRPDHPYAAFRGFIAKDTKGKTP